MVGVSKQKISQVEKQRKLSEVEQRQLKQLQAKSKKQKVLNNLINLLRKSKQITYRMLENRINRDELDKDILQEIYNESLSNKQLYGQLVNEYIGQIVRLLESEGKGEIIRIKSIPKQPQEIPQVGYPPQYPQQYAPQYPQQYPPQFVPQYPQQYPQMK